MSTKEPFSELELNTYEVGVPLDFSAFRTAEEAELAIVETVANSIVGSVDELDDDDVGYVSTQVTYDETQLEDAFNDEDIGIATVQTVTELAHVNDHDE